MKRILAILCLMSLLIGCAGDRTEDKEWKFRPFFKIGHGQHAISHRVELEVGVYGYYGISKWGLGWTPSIGASNHKDPMFDLSYPMTGFLSWEMRY